MKTTKVTTILAALLCGAAPVSSFSTPRSTVASVSGLVHAQRVGSRYMFFADAAVENNESSSPNDVQIAPLDGSESSIDNAARFMVDAFWLQSPQQLIQNAGDSSAEISESAKTSLTSIQANDLMDQYGERMGKRKLDALILAAMDGDNSIQGMVTIEVRLLDKQSDILLADASERMLTQAVASLGPKQRREYKDASVIDIANQLLPPDIIAVCSLSNLCVSPAARRRGIAGKLCSEAERVAKEELGFEEMYLRVEASNEAAKTLYEQKLGYENVMEVNAATALRVDGDTGSFVEVESDIIVLKKKIC